MRAVFAHNLKRIRKSKKLTQGAVGEKMGIDASAFSRLERTEGPGLTSDTIERAAAALDVPFQKLFMPIEIEDASLLNKIQMIEELSEYNRNVVNIMLDSVIEKDRLEKLQEVKMKNRLAELESIRKKI